MNSKKKSILVTGTHRSGSTWVGKVLAASPDVGYIQEPFNPGRRPGICNLPISNWFQYVCSENERDFITPLQRSLSFRYDFGAEIQVARSLKDYLRMGRDAALFAKNRFAGATPLMKDPIAFFSAPWLASTFNMSVVILVRHPAAFAHSLRRLNWTFDFDELLSQSQLMENHLSSFEDEIRFAKNNNVDILEQAALFWKIVYTTASTFLASSPDMFLIKHEDLALNPLDNFRSLCKRLDVTWSKSIQGMVVATTSEKNPATPPEGAIHFHKRDSARSIDQWKEDLSEGEVDKIRTIVGTSSEPYYTDGDWIT